MNKQKGYIVIMNTLAFITISIVLMIGVASPVFSSFAIGKAFIASSEAFIIANSASEELLYRLKRGLSIPSGDVLELANGQATFSTSDSGENKLINIQAVVGEFERNLSVIFNKGVGVSFNYGMQMGQGGFEMSGTSGVYGNVYSNGDITGSNNSFITGSAIVANQSDPNAHISNLGNDIPEFQYTYGGATTTSDFAQSFSVSTTTPVTSINLYIKKENANLLNNTTLRITSNNSDKPSKTVLATGIISPDLVTTAYNYLNIPLNTALVLTPNTTYWMVFDTSASADNFYTLAANNAAYQNGKPKNGNWASNNGGTWTDPAQSNHDIYFEIFIGGDYGKISNMNIGSEGGDAWAHEVNGSNVSDILYCQIGSGNNQTCDTSRADPTIMPMPVSDGNVEEWKSVAESGTIHVGDLSYSGQDAPTLGRMKIEGNLSVGSGVVVTLTDTVWVTGNIDVSGGGATIKLGTNYNSNSGIIVADGRIEMSGGGSMQGSGATGSYILAVTTSACPYSGSCSNGKPAISVTGSTGSVVLNAQNGDLEFSGGASAKQATAKKIKMAGGSTVTYESGLTNINFKSGPSGSWNLISWDEVE